MRKSLLRPVDFKQDGNDAAVSRLVRDIFYVRRQQLTDGNICSSDVWQQISDAQSAVGKLKRKREVSYGTAEVYRKKTCIPCDYAVRCGDVGFYIDKTGSRRSGNRQSEPESIG